MRPTNGATASPYRPQISGIPAAAASGYRDSTQCTGTECTGPLLPFQERSDRLGGP